MNLNWHCECAMRARGGEWGEEAVKRVVGRRCEENPPALKRARRL